MSERDNERENDKKEKDRFFVHQCIQNQIGFLTIFTNSKTINISLNGWAMVVPMPLSILMLLRAPFPLLPVFLLFFFIFDFYFAWFGLVCIQYSMCIVCYLNISHLIEHNWHFDQDFKFVMHFMLHQNEIKWF